MAQSRVQQKNAGAVSFDQKGWIPTLTGTGTGDKV
jgi:hypothetical protein